MARVVVFVTVGLRFSIFGFSIFREVEITQFHTSMSKFVVCVAVAVAFFAGFQVRSWNTLDCVQKPVAVPVPRVETSLEANIRAKQQRRLDHPTTENEEGLIKAVHDDYALASSESFGFFTDVPAATWKRQRNRHQTTAHRGWGHPNAPNVWYAHNSEPSFTCQHELRLGGTGDGPKWVCDPHRLTAQKDCLVYSVGSNNNFEFEKSVYNDIGPHCEIHTFDPSVSFVKATNRPDYVNYHHWGFSASDLNVEDPGLESKQGVGQNANQNTWVMRSLATAVKHLGHEGRSIHLFKIDCEGCEFHRNPARESFWDTMAGVDIDIRQILVELHYRTDTKVANPQTGAISPYPASWWFFERMKTNGYAIFHKEPNTEGCKGDCIEFSLIHLADGFFENK